MTEVNQWKADLTFESMHKLNDIDNPHIVASLLVCLDIVFNMKITEFFVETIFLGPSRSAVYRPVVQTISRFYRYHIQICFVRITKGPG